MKTFINGKTIGLMIFIILAALLFFSKTIYFYNTPMVTIAFPKGGDLLKKEDTTGVAAWENIYKEYSKYRGKVATIHIKEGDTVKAGQPLITLSYDKDESNRKLKEIENNKKQLLVDIDGIQQKINNLQEKIENERSKQFVRDGVSTSDLTKAENRIANLKEELERKQSLYDAGVIAKEEVDKATQDLQSAQLDYQGIQQTIADQEEKINKNAKDFYSNIQDTIRSTQEDIETQKLALKTKQLAMESYNLQASQMLEDIQKLNANTVISASTDGVVSELLVNVGQVIEASTYVAAIGEKGSLTVSCEISSENTFIGIGDVCTLTVLSKKINGTVTQLKTKEGKRYAIVKIEGNDVTNGQVFDVSFEKKIPDQKVLVPNGGINKDKDGYFIYEIKERDGILGKEYYANVLRVTIGESDNNYTAITKGITFFEPIVILSNKPFVNGDTVQVKNEADLIAKQN